MLVSVLDQTLLYTSLLFAMHQKDVIKDSEGPCQDQYGLMLLFFEASDM